MVAPAVPEIVESEIQESVTTRTESLPILRELGPPDLVHLTKSQPKVGLKEIGTYHHVTGVDASSSASLAAYINTLTYLIGENQIWFGKPQSWRITTGIYCCYNAFSRVDMRVEVKIPGSVEAYAVDERGEKRMASELLWLETYLCGVLRAFNYADDQQNRIVGCRRFNPITNTEAEHKFLDAAERLFSRGWQLGSDPEIQVPSMVSNYLTSGLLTYIHTTGRFASGVNLFEKLRSKEPEVASLLARVLIDADEEVKAVSLLYETIKLLPLDSGLLDVQAAFCMSKGRYDLALECAKKAVNSAPSEFTTWERLAQVYLKLEQYELALLTLNSCPMFTYQDRDHPKMPQPTKMHLPVLAESVLDEMSDESHDPKHDKLDAALLKLPAASLKGTFAKAYKLLTEITSQIGWDMLLKYRSNVFVMEEEYRFEKSARRISTQKYSHIQNKRLCERWLDNLFMVLYEDLRVYTIWRSDLVRHGQQKRPYRKSATELEILGELAQRLHHHAEAEEAFQSRLQTRFSARALRGVLQTQEKNKDNRGALNSIIRLTAWQYRWYSEFSPAILYSIRKLIAEDGAVKVRSIVQATNFPQSVLDLTHNYAQLCAAFRSSGSDG
ncbi:Chs5p-Arf1p-binding proteins-domain-containing protein [Tuber brumale]|nr:Chs5p-Arf1p-binding proteins-domain-containing protein [Tuber brumale]